MTAADLALGCRPVATVAQHLSASYLRVIAYHDVADAGAFEAQIRALTTRFRPMSGAGVAAALRTGDMPRNAIWLTFDDGDRSVVERALPVLTRLGVPATMFVCPGVTTTDRVPWWRTVTASLANAGPFEFEGRIYDDRQLVIALKAVDDGLRRRVVDELAQRSDVAPEPVSVDVELLRQWTAAGYEVGNHTWDHPCLDHCDDEQIRTQITRSHEWLTDELGSPPRLFAYPNGDWAPAAERVLAELNYDIALLFDHRLVERHPDRLRISRLRLDADAPTPRALAIASGAHSALFGATKKLRRR